MKSIKTTGLILITATTITILACGSSTKEDQKQTTKLSKEIKDVQTGVNESFTTEKNEMKYKIDSIVGEFNKQLDQFESDINEKGNKLDAESEQVLEKLKAERDSLDKKMDVIESKTNEEWKQMNAELEHNIREFSDEIKSFFEKANLKNKKK